MKKRISFGSIAGRLSDTTRRFPVSIMIIAALAVLLFITLHRSGGLDQIDYRVWLWLGIGLPLSVAASLAVEDRLGRVKTALITLGIVLLWGVYCMYLPKDDDYMFAKQAIQIGVIGGSAFVAVFFISHLQKSMDRQWWNFAAHILGQLMLGAIFAGILHGGLSLAFFALNELFHVDVDDKIFGDLAILCYVVFAPLYVLSNIPSGVAKYDDSMDPHPLQKVLGLYILAPLLAIYALILYAYFLKIVAAWELPDGWVSWLVTTLAMGGLVVTLCLYPLRMRGGNKMVDFVMRWLGIIILPLLVLMTVGIIRRVSDYGLTINRCYIALLNLWFYGIYTYLFIVRGRRVKWIVISPVVIALLASIGWWSAANVTHRSIVVDIGNYLGQRQLSLTSPNLDPTDIAGVKRLRSDIMYLDKHFGQKSIVPFFTDPIGEMSVSQIFYKLAPDVDYYESEVSNWFFSDNTVEQNQIQPLGDYDHFVKIEYSYAKMESEQIEIDQQDGELVIRILESGREFRISLQKARDKAVIRGEDFEFMVSSYTGSISEDESIQLNIFEGYLFY